MLRDLFFVLSQKKTTKLNLQSFNKRGNIYNTVVSKRQTSTELMFFLPKISLEYIEAQF